MRVGIITRDANAKSGSYQYSLSVIHALLSNSKHEYYVFHDNVEDIPYKSKSSESIIVRNKESPFIKLFRISALIVNTRFPFGKYGIMESLKLHLLVNPQTAGLTGYYFKIPYIVSIADMMHKYYPYFPEYPFRERIRRDIVYSKAAKNAIFTVVDSQQGKEDLIKFYNIKREKIKIIPFIPPPYIYKYRDISRDAIEKLLSKYELPDRYIFYPAQFWFHKNHVRLLKALSIIRNDYQEEIPIVLVGSDKGNLDQVMSVVNELSMKEQVYYLGYVSNLEMVALYKKSTALIFPSLFGPTNIPIIEAMVLGAPVACSNLFSMPEQVKDAGLLFNPFEIEDIAEKIYIIWKDENLRQKLVQNGYKEIKDVTFENYAKKWNELIEEAFEVIGKSARR